MIDREPDRLVTIGHVKSIWTDKHAIPVQGCDAQIEIEPAYEPGLKCIERASHLVVIAWMHQADRSVLQARPRKLKADAESFGVFATRAPVRPNPLSLNIVELVKRDGLVLHVTPLDLVDGTPIVDIKVYSPGWDCVFAAATPRRVPGNLLPDERLVPFLQRDLRNHVGRAESLPLAQMALRAVMQATRHFEVDPRDCRLRVETNGCDLGTDALMALTGASFSNGRLSIVNLTGPRQACFCLNGRRLEAALE